MNVNITKGTNLKIGKYVAEYVYIICVCVCVAGYVCALLEEKCEYHETTRAHIVGALLKLSLPDVFSRVLYYSYSYIPGWTLKLTKY